ncbi:PREDICTED: probable protein phosphatase 2C 49 isoform X1 [Tarenaya hassleriana]|uniref:probable protein phosphatase 2C 49 isoform X1 n=1 Tax=Tarenaya hassleriana TaxID=28532 RepID=UPI00053C5500|nr:PREDICTED: probable protein phosphatase 2C 49 isoform X1 [Tarenaya hassleriana]
MVAEAEVVFQQSLPVLDVQLFDGCAAVKSPVSSPKLGMRRSAASVSADLSTSPVGLRVADPFPGDDCYSSVSVYLPTIRSGSCADIGPRRFMEDEHICIDDLPSHVRSLSELPKPSAFYAVFDGHGGPEAASYVRENAIRFFFDDAKFPRTSSEVDSVYLEEVKGSLRNAFLQADLALADDHNVSSSSGTTALVALIFGRLLMVANAGDCRAGLCRKGQAIDMSQDHRPIYPPERRRVEESGGFIDDGYLNGVLSVTRALGDWDMKLPRGKPSPLIADPEIRQITLTEDDEFLIIGCDGVWDVMTSQQAISIVRRGLRRHDDPTRCARELVMEALRLKTFDNLTVVVVCFLSGDEPSPSLSRLEKQQRCCSLTPEAFQSLRSLLDG